MSDFTDDMIETRVVIDTAALQRVSPMQAIDPLWWRIDIRVAPDAYDAAFAPYARRQRLVFAMVWHIAEVGNGGHDQFFWNSTGIVWRDALAGFEDAGLDDARDILRAAAERLGGDPPLEKPARREVIERLNPDFGDLDDALYDLMNTTLNDRIMDYVRAHASEFLFDGVVRKPAGFP